MAEIKHFNNKWVIEAYYVVILYLSVKYEHQLF